MERINFQDGQKTSSAKVTIDEVDYPVTPARYSGATPLSALVLNTMQDNIEDAIDQNVSNIGGEEYDETATYEEGDIVKYEGQLYICIEAIDTPEEWDSTKWNATDVLSSAGGNEVTIGAPEDITGKTKIFIDESEGTDAYSEVVNSLSGNEIAKAPSVRAVNEALSYSTTETVVGTWTDGKPLYKKIFIVNATVPANTATSAGNVTLLNLATYNIDEFFIDFNRLDNADKSVSYYNPFSSGTPRYFAISKVAGNVLANFYNAFSNENVTITFSALYTKTTD